VLDRHAAEGPERVLQVLGERGEALPAQDDPGECPARVDQHEMIQQMGERLARDRDAEPARVREIGQRLLAGFPALAEDHIAARPAQGFPVAHATLQGSPDRVVGKALRIAAHQVAQQRDGLEARVGLQHGDKLMVPHALQRVWDGAPTFHAALGGLAGIMLQASSGAFAHPGPGGGNDLIVALAFVHIQPPLLVGDGSTRHRRASFASGEVADDYGPAPASTKHQANLLGRHLAWARPRPGEAATLQRHRPIWMPLTGLLGCR